MIRKATKKDLNEISKLMRKELSTKPFNEKANSKAVMKSLEFYSKNAKIYISQNKNKKLEGVLVFQEEIWWEGKVIIIQDLVSENKSQKIDSKIMELLIEYSKKNKIKRICFTANKKGLNKRFYKKLGFGERDRISMEMELK